MMIERVHFYSEGSRLAGILYLPEKLEEDERRPAVVLCHGFTGIKELILPQYAQVFADNGFIALTFDYRGFGESDGRRGRLLWQEQLADIRNAVTYVSTRAEADSERIGVWGTSYGGALAPYALAVDDRIKAGVGQLGFADGYTAATKRLPEEAISVFRQMVEEDRRRRVLQNDPMYADAMALASDPEMSEFFEREAQKMPQLLGREIMVQFIEAHMEFSPLSVIHRKGNRPLLLIAAELDVVSPMEDYKELFDKAPEPKKWVVFRGTRHFELYEGDAATKSADEAVAFFREHLKQ
ncbi:MAG: alpha/beta fold hydrolase [Candidatus Abyssobacteria bacterium SURF_5]|uniref:Alpha/beta fold hydrolase n=1 Tax=Abyssobacteria bacterium (strain SURF_5) TaxID=2093360 RepID=A0A3A4NVN6_ABYX5|nr:MAG: alpha/beta fold hydrolase [Candidatus Abyssubacteria bacterium SURF_5]